MIQPTHWPNIDLIGAQLNLYWAEFQVPVWRMQSRGWPLWDALTGGLEDSGLLQEYDIILLDTPPALGYLTINALSAADILLVPLQGHTQIVKIALNYVKAMLPRVERALASPQRSPAAR